MTAPRSRGKPRKRSQVKSPGRPLRNDMVTIFVTFKAVGVFEISFVPYQKIDGKMVMLNRFPTLALSVLRRQLLEVHSRFWLVAKLPVNPTMVDDYLARPGSTDATHRQEYVKLLSEWFNTACQQQGTKAVMTIGRPPQPKAAKKADTKPEPKKAPAKKVAAKKVVAKKAAPAKAKKVVKKTAGSATGARMTR